MLYCIAFCVVLYCALYCILCCVVCCIVLCCVLLCIVLCVVYNCICVHFIVLLFALNLNFVFYFWGVLSCSGVAPHVLHLNPAPGNVQHPPPMMTNRPPNAWQACCPAPLHPGWTRPTLWRRGDHRTASWRLTHHHSISPQKIPLMTWERLTSGSVEFPTMPGSASARPWISRSMEFRLHSTAPTPQPSPWWHHSIFLHHSGSLNLDQRLWKCPLSPASHEKSKLLSMMTSPTSYWTLVRSVARVMLADSIGFTYTKKRETKAGKVTWRCSVRSAAHTCKAGVTQTGQEYTRTAYGHDHPAQPGIAERIRKTKAIHQKAKENVFTSAANIMEEVMQGTVDLKAPAATRPVPVNVVRSANYQRSKGRPKAPTNLDFDVDMAWVDPDFLRKDLHVSGARHLIFATSTQLELLSTASTIFCDATFKVVSPPFYQLFSVHAFLHDANGQEVKQVPLVFALMSRRRKKVYKAVFRAVLELAPSLAPEEMVTDFEDRGNPGQALEAMETVQETGHQHPPAPQATWTRGSSNWSEKVIPSPTPPFLGPKGSRLRLPHPNPTPAFPGTYGFPAKVLRTPAFTGTYGFPAKAPLPRPAPPPPPSSWYVYFQYNTKQYLCNVTFNFELEHNLIYQIKCCLVCNCRGLLSMPLYTKYIPVYLYYYVIIYIIFQQLLIDVV